MGERFLFKEENVGEDIENEHYYRYQTVAPFLHGMVIDTGCGGGYGSEIIASNPHVDSVWGLDYCAEAIDYARKYHQGPKTIFDVFDLNLGPPDLPTTDCIVAIEVVEHLAEPENFIALAKARCNLIAVSTPIIPTKHMNPWHLHDFTTEQVRGWFSDWDEIYFDIPDGIAALGVYEKL